MTQTAVWLRLEGLAVFVASLLFYRWQLESWWKFAGLFLLPDISFLGFFGGPALGARIYNLAHNYVVPIFLTCWGLAIGREDVVPLALIWVAHIGFDRMLGFNLRDT